MEKIYLNNISCTGCHFKPSDYKDNGPTAEEVIREISRFAIYQQSAKHGIVSGSQEFEYLQKTTEAIIQGIHLDKGGLMMLYEQTQDKSQFYADVLENPNVKSALQEVEIPYSDVAATEFEVCASCGAVTNVLRATSVEFRDYYVEGCGQLCYTCFTHMFQK